MANNSKLGLKIGLVVIVVCAGIFGAIVSLRPEARVAQVVKGTARDVVPGSVVVRAEYAMELKSEIGGRIVSKDYQLDPGQAVKAGAVLVRIDTGDIDLDIDKTQSDYEATKKRIAVGSQIALELETAKADLDNSERLFKLGSISDTEIQRMRRSVKQIEQKLALEDVANKQLVEGIENSLKTKQRQREKMTITAPFDGVVEKVLARPGDLIGGGSPIATLIATSRTVEAKISEENFSGIKLGQKAWVHFLGYAPTYEATVTKILPTADPETQRYIVYLEIKNIAPELLVPGITGEVSIVVAERQTQALVPRRALFGHNVYVVKNGEVELRHVQLGYVDLVQVEIVNGLTEGETVIVEQLDRFHPGERVSTTLVK
jgi:RND family efflux transporter MFP subunit